MALVGTLYGGEYGQSFAKADPELVVPHGEPLDDADDGEGGRNCHVDGADGLADAWSGTTPQVDPMAAQIRRHLVRR